MDNDILIILKPIYLCEKAECFGNPCRMYDSTKINFFSRTDEQRHVQILGDFTHKKRKEKT